MQSALRGAGIPLPARWLRGLLPLALALLAGGAAADRPPPRTIDELRALQPASGWTAIRELPDGPGFAAQLVAYRSAGLAVHALVATPRTPPPAGGYPVLVANHGFHPAPERYGFTAQGEDARPGDYYRPVPAAYAAHGFIVVMPDYRGHNRSEGRGYTGGFLASSYYTEDVLALLPGLDALARANRQQVFMWGHSMGGEVTLRALLATDRIRGASLWSTVSGDVWEQAYHASRRQAQADDDGSARPKPRLDALRREVSAWGPEFRTEAREPLAHLHHLRTPVLLQHAVGDASAPHAWSMRLAGELARRGLPYRFHSVAGDDHFFQGETFRQAVDRDVRFFRALMQPRPEEPTRDAGAATGQGPGTAPAREPAR